MCCMYSSCLFLFPFCTGVSASMSNVIRMYGYGCEKEQNIQIKKKNHTGSVCFKCLSVRLLSIIIHVTHLSMVKGQWFQYARVRQHCSK